MAYENILGLRREDTTPYNNHQYEDTTTTASFKIMTSTKQLTLIFDYRIGPITKDGQMDNEVKATFI